VKLQKAGFIIGKGYKMNIDKILNDLNDPDSVIEFFDNHSGIKITVEYLEIIFDSKRFAICIEQPAKDIVIMNKSNVDRSDSYEYLDTFLNGFWCWETGSSVFSEVEKD